MSNNILIVESRYYNEISDLLLDAVIEEINTNEFNYNKIEVLGALEIPIAISRAIKQNRYNGFIGLGCVIRGQTSHFDIVSKESARALMDLAINNAVPITNGILTVDNKEQAIHRADKNKKNVGGHAAKSCIQLIKYFNSI